MNIINLKKIRDELGIEISDSMNLIGKKEMNLLCQCKGMIDLLISRLEFPEKYKKLEGLYGDRK